MSENSNDTIESLTRKIDYMKKDIQYLIDKKKHTDDDEQVKKINEEKDVKMKELKEYSDKLRELSKMHNKQQKMEREMLLISRTLDSLDFAQARKKKTQDAMTKAKESKELREVARHEYEMFKLYEQEYKKVDSKKYPGMLFLHNNIVSKYGICPYIKIESEKNTCDNSATSCDNLELNRYNWLNNQEDNGKIYYDLYNRIILKENYNFILNKINNIEEECNKLLYSSLDESRLELLRTAISFIEEYTNSLIKTKKLKERLKVCIHNMSILYSETKIEIHEFFSLKYKIPLVVNDIVSERSINSDKIYYIISERFNNLLESYKQYLEELQSENKYITNTIRNLNNDIYEYLKNDKNIKDNNIKKLKYIQQGKYFKKWSSLSSDDKLDRLYSYGEYYIRTNVLKKETEFKDTEERQTNSDNLNENDVDNKIDVFLNNCNTFMKKCLYENLITYKDIKWNINKGIIENIKTLEYDITKNEFNLIGNKMDNKIDNTDTSDKKRSIKKISQKSIITKNTETMLNEQILMYIVKNIKVNCDKEMEKENKDKCLEMIKNKLKVKKLSNVDKSKILEKYDEIFKVVINNKC